MSETIKAKMKIVSVKRMGSHEILKMGAVGLDGKYPADGTDENNTFAIFTPSATLEMCITNPALLGTFTSGDEFSLDFTKVDSTETEESTS